MLDTSKKYAPEQLGSVLVLGLGKTGRAVVSYCEKLLGKRITSLTLAAGPYSQENAHFAQVLNESITVLFDTEKFEEEYDLCIVSPGISQFSSFYQNAKRCSKEMISEVEFAWRESAADSTWVAITGTNGKTTTTALAASLLKAVGKRAQAVGNIGNTCLEAVASEDVDCYVAEVSSYQLASIDKFAPQVSILLNITPDHLKWHTSFEEYCKAKSNIFKNAHAGCTIIMDTTNEVVRTYYRSLRKQLSAPDSVNLIALGTQDGITSSMVERCGAPCAAYCNNGVLTLDYEGKHVDFASSDELSLKGDHNIINALAAACAAFKLAGGDKINLIHDALVSFKPLEHRIEPCGSVAGIHCYNDSKATNVDATLKALVAFGEEKPFVLLGGDDKGTDLSLLVAAASRHTKGVICFGQAAPRFLAAFKDADIPVFAGQHLADSFEAALDYLNPGDILLLSPACASFDEFHSFEERGEVFKELVQRYAKERGV